MSVQSGGKYLPMAGTPTGVKLGPSVSAPAGLLAGTKAKIFPIALKSMRASLELVAESVEVPPTKAVLLFGRLMVGRSKN